ncbi:uncharacterized protein M421DRAFT_126075 [Didymella exigua CBS 183.55]|uniref:Uncharacterized protein n=1 Tax=Didymella exigua CBS 183.55 TaxID=1150837 RepID=A0A6A5RML3_9PLEO|nr:uncharacterized protein M421DRAFT_126075 [Didymella exigua CBS 183.55]KAF1929655.1 hypothetical protein M421DRAFT_126075 [Didymella exigua CBS 183.55]
MKRSHVEDAAPDHLMAWAEEHLGGQIKLRGRRGYATRLTRYQTRRLSSKGQLEYVLHDRAPQQCSVESVHGGCDADLCSPSASCRQPREDSRHRHQLRRFAIHNGPHVHVLAHLQPGSGSGQAPQVPSHSATRPMAPRHDQTKMTTNALMDASLAGFQLEDQPLISAALANMRSGFFDGIVSSNEWVKVIKRAYKMGCINAEHAEVQRCVLLAAGQYYRSAFSSAWVIGQAFLAAPARSEDLRRGWKYTVEWFEKYGSRQTGSRHN